MKIADIKNPSEMHRVIMYNESGNKALYHNRNLMHVSGNIYVGEFKDAEYGDVRCDVFVCWPDVPVGLWACETDAKYRDDFELEEIINRMMYGSREDFLTLIENGCRQHKHFRFTELEMAKHVCPDNLAAMEESRRIYLEERERKDAEREAQRQAEDAAYVEQRNKEAQETLEKALKILRNGGTLQSEKITIYKTRYDYASYAVLNYLMREYGVKAPLKLQGWINDCLYSVVIEAGRCEHYQYYKRKNGRGSTTICEYINKLILAVKENL